MPYTLMDIQHAGAGDAGTILRHCNVRRERAISGGMLDAHGMVRDIFVEIREDQQQLEHAIALFRLRLVGALFQIFHRRERIGKQPFQAVFRQQGAFTATRESLIGAQERFVEKMIEAKLRTS